MIYSKTIPDFKKTTAIPSKDVGLEMDKENLIVKDVVSY